MTITKLWSFSQMFALIWCFSKKKRKKFVSFFKAYVNICPVCNLTLSHWPLEIGASHQPSAETTEMTYKVHWDDMGCELVIHTWTELKMATFLIRTAPRLWRVPWPDQLQGCCPGFVDSPPAYQPPSGCVCGDELEQLWLSLSLSFVLFSISNNHFFILIHYTTWTLELDFF